MDNEKEMMEQVSTNEQDDLIKMYQNALAEVNTKYVSRESYEQLKKTHNDFVQSCVNGEQIAAATPAPQKKSAKEIYMEMIKPTRPLTNIEFVEKSLEYREALLEETGEDCFVSKGHGLNLTAESYASAQKSADIYRECIDYANGDSQAFTNELQRRMVDNPMANMKNNIKNRR